MQFLSARKNRVRERWDSTPCTWKWHDHEYNYVCLVNEEKSMNIMRRVYVNYVHNLFEELNRYCFTYNSVQVSMLHISPFVFKSSCTFFHDSDDWLPLHANCCMHDL